MSTITATTIQKYSKKSIADLIKLAEKHFNKRIRERDRDMPIKGHFQCISCNQIKDNVLMNAGHFLSAGHNAAVRFDERNVNGQCIRCNQHLHGNLVGYRAGMIRKYGVEAVEDLEQKAKMRGFKWDRFALIEIIERNR